MAYIEDLRKYIGSKPLIMTCSGVLILNNNNQLLLQKRKDCDFWGYPGGSLELGESFEDCARREMLEETGLECLNLKYFASQSGDKMHYTYPVGDEVYIAENVYICDKYAGELKIQKSEVTMQKFFDLAELPSDVSPINTDIINKLKSLL